MSSSIKRPSQVSLLYEQSEAVRHKRQENEQPQQQQQQQTNSNNKIKIIK